MNEFPVREVRIMLHALGVSHTKNRKYVQPNKRYNTYPTSYRNYYQTSDDEHWDSLVLRGLAMFRRGDKRCRDFYFVTDLGKQYLKNIGYSWHEDDKRDSE